MVKKVIYLDQSFLSNVTFARLGPEKYPNIPVEFSDLWGVLLEGAERDELVCPLSPYHFAESELDDRIEQHLYDSMELVHHGVEFLSFPEILMGQTRQALYRYLNDSDAPDPGWAAVYTGDPQATHDGSPVSIERSRGVFSAWTRDTRDYHVNRGDDPPVGDFSAQKTHEIVQVVRELFVKPAAEFQLGSVDFMVFSAFDSFFLPLARGFRDLAGRSPITEDFASFLLDWLPKHPPPFLDIYATMRAHMVTRDQGRNVEGGDLQDVMAASLALPYCDVFTCDTYMKEVLVQSKLHEAYDVDVFCPKVADVAALTADLSGTA